MNNATYGQTVVDNTNRTVSLDPPPENDAIVAIPAPSAEDFSPETEQQAGTKEKVLENSDESNDNGAPGEVEQAEIQKDKVSESDQTSEDRQAQVSEDDSDAREDMNDNDSDNDNDNDDDDVPFELPFP